MTVKTGEVWLSISCSFLNDVNGFFHNEWLPLCEYVQKNGNLRNKHWIRTFLLRKWLITDTPQCCHRYIANITVSISKGQGMLCIQMKQPNKLNQSMYQSPACTCVYSWPYWSYLDVHITRVPDLTHALKELKVAYLKYNIPHNSSFYWHMTHLFYPAGYEWLPTNTL